MKKFTDRIYIGNSEYAICFKKGNHAVYNLDDYTHINNYKPEFIGHYEKCLKFLDDLLLNYQESLF